MFDLSFTVRAHQDLTDFIDAYKSGFVELYSDSGIWSEDTILKQYQQAAESLKEGILDCIQFRLEKPVVFGRHKQFDSYECIVMTKGRLIDVIYSENLKLKERIIERIGINRKPIIF